MVIMPIHNVPPITQRAINAAKPDIIYDDNSTTSPQGGWGGNVVHISDLTSHPSPNYRTILIDAQCRCLARNEHLIIVESDVIVKPDTIARLLAAVRDDIGMVAAITENENGKTNYPYSESKRHLSFCCTLISLSLLRAFDFEQLDSTKNWFDVTISHKSKELEFINVLQEDNRVVHYPHQSRPWKLLKYTNPILYYWRKITKRMDKI